jgi:hypothetical protein
MLVATLAAAAGCDGGGSKRSSLYQQLAGSWKVQRIYLGAGPISVADTARVAFLQEAGQRSYHIVRVASADTTRSGRVAIPRSNMLSMTTGFARPLLWRFDFDEPDPTSTSVQLRLESTWRGSTAAVLEAIGVGGGAQILVVDLERN